MSLTVYFYKVKKGNRPNVSKKEWFSVRRAYNAWDLTTMLGHKSPFNSDLYKVDQKAFRTILDRVSTMPVCSWDYDAMTEQDGFRKAMRRRKIDWEKYDLYVLDA